jgi:flagellar assembly factor FliW
MTNTGDLIRFSSSRFGELEIPESKVINVPDGIIGFPDYTRYALLDPSGGRSLFLWLQAVDEPNLAFIITDPLVFLPEYRIHGSEPDLQRLEVEKKAPPALFVIVAVPPNDPDRVSANLAAPLLYFEADNTLHQIVLETEEWPLRHYLIPEGSRSHAGGDLRDSGEVR